MLSYLHRNTLFSYSFYTQHRNHFPESMAIVYHRINIIKWKTSITPYYRLEPLTECTMLGIALRIICRIKLYVMRKKLSFMGQASSNQGDKMFLNKLEIRLVEGIR